MRYNVIGTMSGTSLDGLDIAYCSFELINNQWTFEINETTTNSFPKDLKENLQNAMYMDGLDLMQTSNQLGNFIGQSVNSFIENKKINFSLINGVASHGHTVFHQPGSKLTTQIGNGAVISALTKLPVVCDFRAIDMALGGQGAPLVPIGDKLLFSEYDFCINLGGIANISYDENGKTKDNDRIAFDICPVNIVLNKLVQEKGLDYDNNGDLARKGTTNKKLLEQLNLLPYYKQPSPKSLGMEWVAKNIFPLLDASPIAIEDKLHTFVVHIAQQISVFLNHSGKKALFTGGGTHNLFLMEKIRLRTAVEIIAPSKEIIDFKEALIFAFLGVLKLRNEVNCLSAVTGASNNSVGGCVYQAF